MKLLAIRGDSDKYESIIDLLIKIGGVNENKYSQVCNDYRSNELTRLQKLLICRDAYIKLDNTCKSNVYRLAVPFNGMIFDLMFNSQEMAAEFNKNFKDLIICG